MVISTNSSTDRSASSSLLDKLSERTFAISSSTSSKELKSVIGSGGIYQKEWIPTGIETINVSDSKTWSRFFKPNSLSAILGEHIWEHLSIEEAELALENCYRFLNKGGYVRIAVPDGFHPDPKYIKGCGSIGPKEEH